MGVPNLQYCVWWEMKVSRNPRRKKGIISDTAGLLTQHITTTFIIYKKEQNNKHP